MITKKVKDYDKIVLSGDIGGTNANFCIAGIKKGIPHILLQGRESTGSVDDLSRLVNNFIAEAQAHNFNPETACLAVAGPIETRKDYQKVQMTNTDLLIDTRKLKRNTGLKDIMLMNDFDAVSYAINVLDRQDFIVLNKGRAIPKAVKAVLGAGTGLGKNILHYHEQVEAYVPLPSEGGHADLPLLTTTELKMAEFIKKINGIKRQLCYEDVLSGRGLENIYKYLSTSKYPELPIDLTAAEISTTQNDNSCSQETFEWFIRFYARCARNFALDTLARGGLYIAGGIAAKNHGSFTDFVEEFIRNEVYENILQNIPIYLITNYNISLTGAAYALTFR
jgi:glucokinase